MVAEDGSSQNRYGRWSEILNQRIISGQYNTWPSYEVPFLNNGHLNYGKFDGPRIIYRRTIKPAYQLYDSVTGGNLLLVQEANGLFSKITGNTEYFPEDGIENENEQSTNPRRSIYVKTVSK
ncbi:unnamed protein product [Enterobius vermicularis]|uniref:RagB/SusD family nutrient uptake outer membrane protein n=1 Tax=Enterobius vermicularis TaxID=51028 RepID=A0A0N4VBE8_ENTVE|nr:unnamed protein product [Enterobius vermicularis]